MAELADALTETGSTIPFEAIGGGKLAGQTLSCMEVAINRKPGEYSRYGSSTPKQINLYGMLDPAPTEIVRNFGMAWASGGWLLIPFLQKIGPAAGAGTARACCGRAEGAPSPADTRARYRWPRRCRSRRTACMRSGRVVCALAGMLEGVCSWLPSESRCAFVARPSTDAYGRTQHRSGCRNPV